MITSFRVTTFCREKNEDVAIATGALPDELFSGGCARLARPFLGIYLTEQHWRPDDIGFVMTAGGIAALLATVPAGIMIDATRKKRLLSCSVYTVDIAFFFVRVAHDRFCSYRACRRHTYPYSRA